MTIEYVTIDAKRSEDLIRDLVAYLAIYACTNETMVSVMPSLIGEPVYEDVTQGLYHRSKKEGWFFSSCAYLPHWALEHAGFAFVRQIGRTGRADNPLSRLAYHEASEPARFDSEYESGDIVQIGDTNWSAHIGIVLADDAAHEQVNAESHGVLFAQYGQEGRLYDGKPIGGEVRLLKLTRNDAKQTQSFNSRVVCRVLRISALLENAGNLSPFRIPKRLYEWPGFAPWRAEYDALGVELDATPEAE